MNYERRIVSKNDERDIITGLIVSTEFIKQIRDTYKPEYFTLPYARTVSQWCIEYYDKYEKSPFKDIKSLFESKKDTVLDTSQLEMIDSFLANLSATFEEEPEHYNVQYNVDKAVSFFKGQSLDILIEQIKAAKLNENHAQAESIIANYKRVEKFKQGGIDIWENPEAHLRALRSYLTENSLLQLPGELGHLIRPFNRGDFVAVFAPFKRYKSLFLQEMALQASFNKLNVLYISLEMTEDQMLTRIQQRLTASLPPNDIEREVLFPSFDTNYERTGAIYTRSIVKRPLTSKDIMQRIDTIKSIVRSKRFNMICLPSGGMKASDINIYLDNYEHYDGFVPDVIVADYGDLFTPERKIDKRDQIDETWKILRGISQERNILFVTASHTNKATLERDIKQGDASEDIRKMNHLTLALAFNQNNEDKQKGLMRVSVLADRFRSFNPLRECAVLQCVDIGQFYLDSRIMKISEAVSV